MVLTPSDIARIERLGYALEEFAIKSSDGFYRLKNINGHCYFFDIATTSCKIYEHRPIGCRIYPLVIVLDLGIITVDNACPAKGSVEVEDVIKKLPLIAEVIEELGVNFDLGKAKIVLY